MTYDIQVYVQSLIKIELGKKKLQNIKEAY